LRKELSSINLIRLCCKYLNRQRCFAEWSSN